MADPFPKDMFEDLKDRVPKTRVGFVQHYLARIEASMAAGHSVKDIWEYSRERGFDVSYNDFCKYLRMVRSRKKPGRIRSRPDPQLPSKPASARETPPEPPGHDPLANWRRVEANRFKFDYRGTEDLEELVYGRKRKDEEKQ